MDSLRPRGRVLERIRILVTATSDAAAFTDRQGMAGGRRTQSFGNLFQNTRRVVVALKVYIDDPEDLQIRRYICKIRGWCAGDSTESLQALRFRIGGSRVPYTRIQRPDVEEVLHKRSICGFLIHLDLSSYMHGLRDGEFLLKVVAVDEPEIDLRFRVSSEALGKCLETLAG